MCGYNNIKLATYQIINISDDKPKFLLKRLNQVKNGDGKITDDNYIEIVGDTYTGSRSQTSFDYNISLYSNLTINKPITARVIYPGKYFEYSGTDPNVIKKANGWLEIKFEDNHRIILTHVNDFCEYAFFNMVHCQVIKIVSHGFKSVWLMSNNK